MDLHPDCEPLAFLLGTWRGRGDGEYPTIEPFSYLEEVVFGHVGKPFLSYAQKTRDAATDQPLHAETGWLRAVGGDLVELVIAQPSGIVELHSGRVADGVLHLQLDAVLTTPRAKSVTDVVRRVNVRADVLDYTVAMAAVGQPLTHHLAARLERRAD